MSLTLLETMQKMDRHEDHADSLEQGKDSAIFAEFAATEYYQKVFMEDLKDFAMNAGLDAKGEASVLEANGKRKAYLELIKKFQRKEKVAREILK